MSKFIRGLVLAGAIAGIVAVGDRVTDAQDKKTVDKVGTLDIAKDKAGLFRFKAVGADGKTIMQSSKGYATRDDAMKAIDAVRSILTKGKVVEKDEK